MQIVLIGCGRMGGALLRGWTAAGIAPVAVIDPALDGSPGPDLPGPDLPGPDLSGARLLADYGDLAGLAGPLCVVLAVKPHLVAGAMAEVRPHLGAGALLVSVAAGVRLVSLQAMAGEGTAVVRTMPNTPAAIGRGVMAAFAGAPLTPAHREVVDRLLAASGEVFWLESEAAIDGVTAISGSGPAYFYRFTELLAEAGRGLGLPDAVAARLARLTFTGAAAWLDASGRDPASLRVEVTSPNGTTAAALAVFDHNDRLAALIRAAADAAVARSREMGG